MTDYRAIFDYEAQPKEMAFECNLCSEPVPRVLAPPDTWTLDVDWQKDRYGYAVATTTCDRCGLVFLNPRMTKEAYARFYADGTYRKLVSAYHGREINAKTIQPEQLVYAAELAEFIGPYMEGMGRETLLDVGGSTGVVAGYLCGRFELTGTVLDPAPGELAEAHGLAKIHGAVEDFDPKTYEWDVITLCQTVDHLLDIAGTLEKLRGHLTAEGMLFVDIVDYDRTRTIKIDHPYNLTPATMRAYLQRAGFGDIEDEPAGDGSHHRFVAAF